MLCLKLMSCLADPTLPLQAKPVEPLNSPSYITAYSPRLCPIRQRHQCVGKLEQIEPRGTAQHLWLTSGQSKDYEKGNSRTKLSLAPGTRVIAWAHTAAQQGARSQTPYLCPLTSSLGHRYFTTGDPDYLQVNVESVSVIERLVELLDEPRRFPQHSLKSMQTHEYFSCGPAPTGSAEEPQRYSQVAPATVPATAEQSRSAAVYAHQVPTHNCSFTFKHCASGFLASATTLLDIST